MFRSDIRVSDNTGVAGVDINSYYGRDSALALAVENY